jgi:aryl-alcohol dehydrogenase-like predicted oxidoreductase
MKLILGSAQFQNGYGITRKKHILKNKIVNKIFKIVQSKNINFLDTAENYKINNFRNFKKNINNFKIITKYETFPQHNIYHNLKKKIKRDLKKYKVKKLYCLHFHRSSEILKKNSNIIISALRKIKKVDNLISNIGVSVYEPNELRNVLKIFTPDVIQLPLNILNQEFAKKKLLDTLKKKNIKIHVRSIFLQGLLLNKKNFLNDKKFFNKKKIKKLKNYLIKKNMSMVHFCINYIKQFKFSGIIFSCEDVEQINEILNNYKKKTIYGINYSQFRSKNINLIDPRKWKKK